MWRPRDRGGGNERSGRKIRLNQPERVRPFFSIIIPTYNRAHSIKQAINSCLSQTFIQFEVVIVDDGSNDDTDQIVRSVDDHRIVYISQQNAGASIARNTGAAYARGEYLAFLDSDDEFLPGKLEAFHQAIKSTSINSISGGGCIVWYSPLWFQRGQNNRICKPSRAIERGERVGDYLFADEGMMQTSTLVVPKDLFAKVGFDPELRCLEDLDLCLRLEAAGANFSMLPDPLVIWHDETGDGRLSYTTSAKNVLDWANQKRDLLSEKAYRGFLARYSVPIVARNEPVKAFRILVMAVLQGSVSVSRALSLLLRGTAPGAYGRVRDALVARRRI